MLVLQLLELMDYRGREADGGFCSPQQSCNISYDKVVYAGVKVIRKLGGKVLGFLGSVVEILDLLVITGLNHSSQRILKPGEDQNSTRPVRSGGIYKSAMQFGGMYEGAILAG
jgi:hypothetical protein